MSHLDFFRTLYGSLGYRVDTMTAIQKEISEIIEKRGGGVLGRIMMGILSRIVKQATPRRSWCSSFYPPITCNLNIVKPSDNLNKKDIDSYIKYKMLYSIN